jgi:xanthine dehydrogenase accessory factor
VEAGLTDAELARLHGPAGLDVGAESPAETAVSILAEALAVRSGREGGPLRASSSRIHVER